MFKSKSVPVYDRAGRVLAYVSKNATSIGAAKAASARACEWSSLLMGWVVKI